MNPLEDGKYFVRELVGQCLGLRRFEVGERSNSHNRATLRLCLHHQLHCVDGMYLT